MQHARVWLATRRIAQAQDTRQSIREQRIMLLEIGGKHLRHAIVLRLAYRRERICGEQLEHRLFHRNLGSLRDVAGRFVFTEDHRVELFGSQWPTLGAQIEQLSLGDLRLKRSKGRTVQSSDDFTRCTRTDEQTGPDGG